VLARDLALTSRGRATLAAVLLAGVAAGCTGASGSGHQAARAAEESTSAAASAVRTLGAPGCHPASPVVRGAIGSQIEGTGHGAQLWALTFFAHAGPPGVGAQEKVVWRMTGTGRLRLTAVGPGGRRGRLVFGPQSHGGSNWTKPGQQWGAGYVFTAPGCWDLHEVRGRAAADVWLQVVAR
jgi:hypothetical protein